MSLINDALKAAQRERSGRAGETRHPVPMFEGVFPYPAAKKSRLPAVVVISGVAIAFIAIAVTAAIVKWRVSSIARPNVTTSGTPARATTPKSSVTSAVAPPPAVTASAPILSNGATPTSAQLSRDRSKLVPPPASNTVAAPKPGLPAQRNVATRTVSSAPADSSATYRSSAPAVTSEPPSASGPQVRLVLDPVGARPADSLSRLAYAEHMRNNLESARDLYEKAIATKQAPAEAFNNYGVLLEQQGNRGMATEMFRQAIARDESNVEAWVNLGDSFIAAGHHGSALSAFDRARQLDPNRAAIKIRLASQYVAIGDTGSARRTFDDAVRVAPNDARVHHAYGSFLQTVKDYQGAIREFDLFVERAEKAPTEFSAEKITEMRRHIATLRRVAP